MLLCYSLAPWRLLRCQGTWQQVEVWSSSLGSPCLHWRQPPPSRNFSPSEHQEPFKHLFPHPPPLWGTQGHPCSPSLVGPFRKWLLFLLPWCKLTARAPFPALLALCSGPPTHWTCNPGYWALVPAGTSLRSAENRTLLAFNAVFILKRNWSHSVVSDSLRAHGL